MIRRYSPIKPSKGTRDRVTAELWQAVMERDKGCILARLDPQHRCSGYITVEHVKDQLRMGKRAPSDLAHLVAMCYGGNVGVPSKTQRAAIRAYLAGFQTMDAA